MTYGIEVPTGRICVRVRRGWVPITKPLALPWTPWGMLRWAWERWGWPPVIPNANIITRYERPPGTAGGVWVSVSIGKNGIQ